MDRPYFWDSYRIRTRYSVQQFWLKIGFDAIDSNEKWDKDWIKNSVLS